MIPNKYASSFGEILGQGSYSTMVKLPQKESNLFQGMIITENEDKYRFQKQLFSFYGIQLGTLNEHDNYIYSYELPILKLPIDIIFSERINLAFQAVSDAYHHEEVDVSDNHDRGFSASSILEKEIPHPSPSELKILDAISMAEHSMVITGGKFRWDLHSEQFLYLDETLICVDPVIFEESFL